MDNEDEARRKEREANQIPEGPRWLWDWTWWVAIVIGGLGWYLASKLNGN
jgi:hypothetical protein